jgi:hypothetical protein
MVTAKKNTVKKTSTAKKAPAKRVAATKKKASASAIPKMRSFHVSPDYPSFGTFKITRQTLYWIIIVSFIIFMQLWILALQIETSTYIENQLSALQSGI